MDNKQKRIDAVKEFVDNLDAYGHCMEAVGKQFDPNLTGYQNLVKAKDISSTTVQQRQLVIDQFIKTVEALYPVSEGE